MAELFKISHYRNDVDDEDPDEFFDKLLEEAQELGDKAFKLNRFGSSPHVNVDYIDMRRQELLMMQGDIYKYVVNELGIRGQAL
jgi:hypothetical protein